MSDMTMLEAKTWAERCGTAEAESAFLTIQNRKQAKRIEELKEYMQYYREGVQYEQAKAIIENGEQE